MFKLQHGQQALLVVAQLLYLLVHRLLDGVQAGMLGGWHRIVLGFDCRGHEVMRVESRIKRYLYSPRDKLRHLPAIVRVVERWPNRSCSHARIWPCHASLSPRTTCRPSPSSAITTPSRSSSASSKSSGSSPRVWPTTTSPASLAPPAPPSSATSARS